MQVRGLVFVGSASAGSTAMAGFLQALGLTAGTLPGVTGDVFDLPDGSTIVVQPGGPDERHRSVGLLVDDLDAAIAVARAAGVEVDAPQDNGRERYAHLTAPDGHLYEFVERR